MYLLRAYAFGDGCRSVSSNGICVGTCALGQQAGRHLTRGVNDPRDPEVARRLHEVVGAQHVVVEDVDLRLAARGRVRRKMTDAVGAELEERVVDLARVREFDPAELSRELQLWSVDDVEIHDLVAGLRQETNNPLSGPSRSSGHDDSHRDPAWMSCAVESRTTRRVASSMWRVATTSLVMS